MPKMAVSVRRAHFSTSRPEACIRIFDDMIGIDRLSKARPSGMALKFVRRGKERLAGYNIDVDARLFVIPIFILEWSFRSIPLRDTILFWRQFGQGVWILVIFGHIFLPLD